MTLAVNMDLGGVAGAGGVIGPGGIAGAGGIVGEGAVTGAGGIVGVGGVAQSGMRIAVSGAPAGWGAAEPGVAASGMGGRAAGLGTEGAGLPAGSGSNIDSVGATAVGPGGGFRAAFARAGGNGAAGETAAQVTGNDKNESWRSATKGGGAPVAENESLKTNWQTMLHPWSVLARDPGEAPEEVESEPDAATDGGGGRSAGSLLKALATVGREAAQPSLAANGGSESTTNAAVSASNVARANQPLPATKSTGIAAGTQSASAWSAAETTGSIGNTPIGSKIKNRASETKDAGELGPSAQAVHAAAVPPIVGSGLAVQAVMPLPMSAPPAQSILSRVPGLLDEADDRFESRATFTNQPAPATAAAVNAGKGVASIMPSMAAATSTSSARASGQIPIHAPRTVPNRNAMNAGAVDAIREPDQEHFDDQEDFATVPSASSMAAGIATGSAPKAASAMDAGTNSVIGEHKTAVEGFAVQRAIGATGGTSAAPASPAAATENPSAENGANRPQAPLIPSTHETAGGANTAVSQQIGAHVAVAQNTGMETSSLARDPASAHGTANTPATIGGSTAGPAPSPQETFAALDAGSSVGAPSWVHAGGRQAEAGFEDPALGWVGVRADLSGGSVHAALVPGSSEAAQALSGHLAGLSTYLSEQHTAVATVTMAAPGNGGIEAGPDQSPGQGMNQGMQQNASERGEQSPAAVPQPGVGAGVSSADSATQANGIDATAYARDGRGTHISVMA